MFDAIFRMMLGLDPEKSKKPKKPTKNEAKEGIIRPFPDAPVRIDFFTSKIYGRCTPEYAAVSYGRMFTRGEERVLAKAMVDACVSFYGERMDKHTLDGFRNYIIRKCKVTSQEYQGVPSSYGTPEKQMRAINKYVESEFSKRQLRETPMDRYYDAYRDLQEIRKIEEIYRSQKMKEEIIRAMDEEEKKRQEEYQKYKKIWY